MSVNTTGSASPARSDRPRLKVVLCWHMHQPQYANRLNGEYQLPWTYLHAMKDYSDMAAHLEAQPGAKAVVNFAPILLEQLQDYSMQIAAYLQTGKEINDPLLAALASAVLPVDVTSRVRIVTDCLRINRNRIVKRFPPFQRLVELADWYTRHQDHSLYINNQFLVDLLVWYHLGWMGEVVRRKDARVKALLEKGQGYSFKDRRLLVEIIGELTSDIIPRYRRLADSGKVELSVSPYAHPIVPLLLDIHSAKQAWPDVQLPLLENYPGGENRAWWHIQHGNQVFEQCFKQKPAGCWPSEGAVSLAAYKLFERAGYRWIASGENVLNNSLHRFDKAQKRPHAAYYIYRFDGGSMRHFFRDDRLSDLIGFTYSDWHADDAVANLLENLKTIAADAGSETGSKVVSIILDGENAWEFYPENGYYFLSALYKRLVEQAGIELCTFSDVLGQSPPTLELPGMVAGSWVYGTFSTWIGETSKNRAWDMLGEAKRCFDAMIAQGHLSKEQCVAAERQLAICEGSDWFWWFGDYNPSATVGEFDRLYRMQLVNLYQILGEQPPEYLTQVFAHGGGDPQHGGVMRRAT